jgi:hypothetical protein
MSSKAIGNRIKVWISSLAFLSNFFSFVSSFFVSSDPVKRITEVEMVLSNVSKTMSG